MPWLVVHATLTVVVPLDGGVGTVKMYGLKTIALVGGKRGKLAELADTVLVIDSTHYGRVEDAQMGICHMLCYAFMEIPQAGAV